jgi:hypothetical protein
MSTLSPDETRVQWLMPFGTNSSSEHRKPDLHKVGKDIYELLTSTGSRGYKQRARKQAVQFKTDDTMYDPTQVAAILNVSYDAALRLMEKMKGVVDLGTPTRRYKRGKKKLRISGKNLLKFLRSKTKD